MVAVANVIPFLEFHIVCDDTCEDSFSKKNTYGDDEGIKKENKQSAKHVADIKKVEWALAV